MSKPQKKSNNSTMLELWRPPREAGDPLGCLATTFMFAPELFDEQCLARFLEIDSEPNRDDLAFLLERETRLGSVYAGVLVDYTQAGVEHSLRWDVLPVRLRAGKQHAKLSLLVWSHHIRIIVASANLTEPGYRTNYEVAAGINLTSKNFNANLLAEAVTFLRSLIKFVPGASENPPEVKRAEAFLDQIEQIVHGWKQDRQRGTIRQQIICTLPVQDNNIPVRSSLEEVIGACRLRGGSPYEAWVASPFFDADSDTSRVTASLCKLMARGGQRKLSFCVPAIRDNDVDEPRLCAPKALIQTPLNYQSSVIVKMLPDVDGDKNRRPWHAKMLALRTGNYSALMVGSSNFTCAGMGVGQYRNAEANLLTIVDRVAYSREVGELEAVWPDMELVADPETAEWIGFTPDSEEERQMTGVLLPEGFLSATYHAGDERKIILRLDQDHLPEDWHVHACGQTEQELYSASDWYKSKKPSIVEIAWMPVQPPEKLLVLWSDNEAFLPINVEDSHNLPPPAQLEHMSADDMLWILAAADPSAAFRAWVRQHQPSDLFDDNLDSATPIDLDPLRQYDLQTTFLHRIRRRARVLAQLRANLQRPVWGRQALEWRLRGLIGVEPLADRMVREFTKVDGSTDEALLALADFMIVLNEVDYQATDGSLPKAEFDNIFRPFVRELVDKLDQQIEANRDCVSKDMINFWSRMVERCQK